MRKNLCQVILAALAVGVFAGEAWAIEEEKTECKKVVVLGAGNDDEGAKVCKKIVIGGGEAAKDGQRVICITTGDKGDGGPGTWVIQGEDGDEQVVKLNVLGSAGLAGGGPLMLTAGAAGDPNRAWLGIGLGEVHPALAAQLGIEGEGVMITNVVKDSPAASAGLEQYDIITAVNGTPLDGSVSAFADLIGEAGTSARVTLEVVHGGKSRTVQVTLAPRPDDVLQWIHEGDVGPTISEKFHTRGKILHRTPQGDIVLDDLGDLKDLRHLPDSIRDLIPDIDDVVTNVWVDAEEGDVDTHIRTRVEKDGQTLEIEAEGDDQITVRHTTVDADGASQTVEKVYTSAEELEAGDPEAFKMYSQVLGRHVFELHLGDAGAGKLHFGLDLDALKEKQGDQEARAEVESAVKEAMKAYQEAMESMKDVHWPPRRGFGAGPGFFFRSGDEPTHSFNVDSNGAIEIRIRQGDSEVVLNYDNEEQLRQRNPEMHEKFAEVMQAED